MSTTLVIIIVCAVIAIALLAAYFFFGRSNGPLTLDIGGAAPRAAGGSDNSPEKTISGRLMGLAAVVAGVIAALVAKLWTMQLVSTEEYAELAESNRTRTITTSAPRGRILDRNGVEIVTNRPSLTVVAEPDVVDDEIEVQLLANLIGMPYMAVRRKIQDSSEGAQSKRTVSVDVSRRVVAFIGEHPSLFNGVSVEERTQRFYPHGSLAAHIVGYTGVVTQEQLDANADAGEGTVKYRSGDTVGQAGIEYQYESVLQGVRGEQTVYVDARGNVLDYSTYVAPQSGSDVMLTIDINVQRAAEESLERVMNKVRQEGYAGKAGCVVALDCTNGEVIAMASAPTFSPNVFVGGISNADWDALQSEDANYPLLNRAISGVYPSGSTIKALTAFAALDYGIATPQSSWYCTGWWTGFGEDYGMGCWWKTGHGAMNLITGLTYSCDVVFYEIGKGFYLADSEGLQETFRRYGLGSASGIDLPSEAVGRVPDAEWKWNYWSDAPEEQRRWQGGDNCNISIGQGDMLVTCLQMADAYCSIANRGDTWRPHLLKSVLAPAGGGTVIEYKPEVIFTNEEDEVFRATIERGLHGVVYEEDYTQAQHWTNLSISVAGKTGTAEQPGEYRDPVGWFVGYGPSDNPKYVIASNMDEVLQGASSAMYVVRDVFGAIYGEPDTFDEDTTVGD